MSAFAHTVRAEWIKFRSLRSTWYTVAGVAAAAIGLATLTMGAAGTEYANATPAERLAWDPTALSLRSYILAQFIIGVLGILIVTSEYATGLLQTTLSATPRRNRLLAAKVVVVAAVAVVVGQALMLAAFLIGQARLAALDVPHASLGDPRVLPAVVAAGLYLSVIALLAVGLGVILRATAGALATLVGIVFLVPALSGIFPAGMQRMFAYWPTMGGAAALETLPNPDFPHPWWNLAGMALGVAAVLAVAFVLFRRRDV